MNCPKCGSENPEGTLFCEECDWRMDQSPKRLKTGINSVYATYAALAFGITSLVSVLINVPVAAVATGAVGMFLSGYAQTAVRVSGISGKLRITLVVMAGAAIAMSVIGFIYGMWALI